MIYIEEGKDYFLDDNEELPYRLVRNLGHGHSALVEEVVDQYTGSVFARKVFRVNCSRTERRRIFANEIKIIRRLARHHHIVRVFATYISRRETGLILSPVASQGDLESFLIDFRDGKCSESSMYTLISAFGCLASGLLFMHTQHVRHKDIKPRNILIHQNSVIFTDFGYSLDHSTETGSTTTGRPQALTKKYCAPEVSEWEPRNAKSDIFSLGCVFFEIYASIGFCEMLGTNEPYHERITELQGLVRGSLGPVNSWFKTIADLTCRMIGASPEQRPPARDIAMELWTHYRGHFCPQCRQSLPAGNIKDFPAQPLQEYYNLMRTNFTTGWITSDEMVSGGMLLDQIRMSQYPENRNGAWTPTPTSNGAEPPTSPSAKNTSDSTARDQPIVPSQGILATSGIPTTPQTPVQTSLPLRRSATVIHDAQALPQMQSVKSPVMNSPKSTRDLVAIPLVPIRTMTSPVESSPKTYAMALAETRERTPSIEANLRFPCLYAECADIFTSEAKLR